MQQPLTYARTHLELLLLEVAGMADAPPERIISHLRETLGGALAELERATAALSRLRELTPSAPRPSPPSVAPPQPAPPPGGARVLIIDDHPQVAQALELLLAMEHEVLIAHEGHQALELIARQPPFDIILCDLMMSGMSGMELHAAIARLRPGLEEHIIFMTGGAFTEEARSFTQRVRNTVLEKPVASDVLRRHLRERLAARTAPPRS